MEQRELALQILYKTIKEESYSNLLMRKELSKIPQIQRAFVTNLVNGVMRNYEDLLFQFEDQIKGQTSLRAKLILCMALYERFFLNEKDYVVNNEYTELGKNRYEKAFINAVLHKCVKKKESDEGYIKANIPKWIYSLLKSQYDETELGKIIDVYQSVPKVYYRLNKSRCSYEDLKGLDINIINEDSFSCDKNLLETLLYKKGYLYVQDVNSASLYKNLDLQKDDVLLDVHLETGELLWQRHP